MKKIQQLSQKPDDSFKNENGKIGGKLTDLLK